MWWIFYRYGADREPVGRQFFYSAAIALARVSDVRVAGSTVVVATGRFFLP
jgi:hypothetical protein